MPGRKRRRGDSSSVLGSDLPPVFLTGERLLLRYGEERPEWGDAVAPGWSSGIFGRPSPPVPSALTGFSPLPPVPVAAFLTTGQEPDRSGATETAFTGAAVARVPGPDEEECRCGDERGPVRGGRNSAVLDAFQGHGCRNRAGGKPEAAASRRSRGVGRGTAVVARLGAGSGRGGRARATDCPGLQPRRETMAAEDRGHQAAAPPPGGTRLPGPVGRGLARLSTCPSSPVDLERCRLAKSRTLLRPAASTAASRGHRWKENPVGAENGCTAGRSAARRMRFWNFRHLAAMADVGSGRELSPARGGRSGPNGKLWSPTVVNGPSVRRGRRVPFLFSVERE